MMTVGIDYGVRRVALGCPEARFASSMEAPEQPTADFDAFHAMASWVAEQLLVLTRDHGEIQLAALEHPFAGSGNANVGTAIRLGMAAGAFGLICKELAIPVFVVQQSTWKKDVLGNGGLDKPGIAREAALRWPDHAALTSGEDELDAMMIGLWAEHHGLPLVTGEATRPEVMDGVLAV